MANKPGEANFFPDVPEFPSMGTFQPVYGKFDLTTYIQGASDYEIMAFLVGKYNACLEAYGNITKLSTDTITACKQLQDWINSWFTNLDVQQELNNKIDSMVQDGSFGRLLHETFDTQINQQTTNTVTRWLVANVTPTGSAVVVDKSLSIEGAAADAKTVGDEITSGLSLYPTYIQIGTFDGTYNGTGRLTTTIQANKNYLIWKNAMSTFTDVINKPDAGYIYIWGFNRTNKTLANTTYEVLYTIAFDNFGNIYNVSLRNRSSVTFTKIILASEPFPIRPAYTQIGTYDGTYNGTGLLATTIKISNNHLIWQNAMSTFTDVINKPDALYTFIWGFNRGDYNLSNSTYEILNTFAFDNKNNSYIVSYNNTDKTVTFNNISTSNKLDNSFTSTKYPPSSKAVSDLLKTYMPTDSSAELVSPNGDKWTLTVSNNGELTAVNNKPKKMSIIGNSLLLGFGYGMAASNNTKDYAAIIQSRIPNCTINKYSGVALEGQTNLSNAKTWTDQNVTNGNIASSDDNLILIQLGDNANAEASKNIFIDSAIYFVQALKNKAPNARIFWCGTWYNRDTIVPKIKEVCKATGITQIDMSSVSRSLSNKLGGIHTTSTDVSTTYNVVSFSVNSPTNLTLNFNGYSATINCTSYSSNAGVQVTVVGKEIIITDPGVASHPGDAGFAEIAKLMLSKFNF